MTSPFLVLEVDDDLTPWSEERFLAELSVVSQQRREKALNYRFASDRQLSLMAYRLLQRMLKQHYGILEPPVFHELEFGKPELVNHAKIHFNLSHCKNGVACAIGDVPVGVDIECIPDKLDHDLAKYVLSQREYDLVLSSANPEVMFTGLWTKKEAYLKLIGEGITGKERLQNLFEDAQPLESVTFERREDLDHKYICHLAY